MLPKTESKSALTNTTSSRMSPKSAPGFPPRTRQPSAVSILPAQSSAANRHSEIGKPSAVSPKPSAVFRARASA